MARLYMQGLYRVRNMSQYASIKLEYDSLGLIDPQYARTWLNIAECP